MGGYGDMVICVDKHKWKRRSVCGVWVNGEAHVTHSF